MYILRILDPVVVFGKTVNLDYPKFDYPIKIIIFCYSRELQKIRAPLLYCLSPWVRWCILDAGDSIGSATLLFRRKFKTNGSEYPLGTINWTSGWDNRKIPQTSISFDTYTLVLKHKHARTMCSVLTLASATYELFILRAKLDNWNGQIWSPGLETKKKIPRFLIRFPRKQTWLWCRVVD